MHSESLHYHDEGIKFQGYFAYDPEVAGHRPAVIIAPAWKGLDDFAKEKAHSLAELGYFAFAADIYGEGKVVKSDDEARELMLPLFIDRKVLRNRITVAFETVKKQPLVDANRIGAIGFCFGGLTVIELLKSGVDVKGVVSFHGLLGDTIRDEKAKTVPINMPVKGSLLILHGYEDPLVSQQDIQNTQKEFTDAKVDWQMFTYGQTSHAFTNPQAQDPKNGLLYNPRTTIRAWQAMENFFDEVFL